MDLCTRHWVSSVVVAVCRGGELQRGRSNHPVTLDTLTGCDGRLEISIHMRNINRDATHNLAVSACLGRHNRGNGVVGAFICVAFNLIMRESRGESTSGV